MRLGARRDALARLGAVSELDFLVVGGGAAGAGNVPEATLRGCRCVLVEGADFASGTSSRSTKQIHGGLRYLIRADVRFVQESLRERTFSSAELEQQVQACRARLARFRGPSGVAA